MGKLRPLAEPHSVPVQLTVLTQNDPSAMRQAGGQPLKWQRPSARAHGGYWQTGWAAKTVTSASTLSSLAVPFHHAASALSLKIMGPSHATEMRALLTTSP